MADRSEPTARIARSDAAVNRHPRAGVSKEALVAVALCAAVVYRSTYCPCARPDEDAGEAVVPCDGVVDENVTAVCRQIDADALSSEPSDDAALDVKCAH